MGGVHTTEKEVPVIQLGSMSPSRIGVEGMVPVPPDEVTEGVGCLAQGHYGSWLLSCGDTDGHSPIHSTVLPTTLLFLFRIPVVAVVM